MLEPSLRFGVAAQRLRRRGLRRHRLLEPAQLLLDRDEIGRAREGVVAQRQAALARRALVVQGDARALLERELAAVDRRSPHERPQERRLARAVRAGEREPVAALDLNETPSKSGEPAISLRRLMQSGRPWQIA